MGRKIVVSYPKLVLWLQGAPKIYHSGVSHALDRCYNLIGSLDHVTHEFERYGLPLLGTPSIPLEAERSMALKSLPF